MAVITSAMTCKKMILEKIDLNEIMTVLSVRHSSQARSRRERKARAARWIPSSASSRAAMTSRDSGRLVSRRLFLGNEVSDAANGVDLHPGAAVGQLLAQAMDVDLDRIGRDVTRQPENVIFDQLLRDDAVLAAHQQFEHGRLAGGENLRLVIDKCLPAFGIECE